MTYVCGIDLGMSRTAIAITSPTHAPRALEWQDASTTHLSPLTTIPTALFFPTESTGIWCGEMAYQALLTTPHRGVQLFKRRMNDPNWYLDIDEVQYDPKALTTAFLKHLRRRTEEQLGAPPEGTCLTVPAHFEDLARRRSIQAAKDAGWPEVTLLNEPTAAAIAYIAANGPSRPNKERLMVFDVGAGTLDVSVLQVAPDEIEVLACLGDLHLGGQDWDECLAWDAAHRFEQRFHWSLFDEPQAFEHLRRASQRAKEQLSLLEKTNFSFTYDDCHLALEWTQTDLEGMSEGLLQRCITVAKSALDEAEVDPASLDVIVLAGGATRMPMIRRRLERVFNCPVNAQLDPGTTIALGAAQLAWQRFHHPNPSRRDIATHNPKLLPGQIDHVGPFQHTQLTDSTSYPLGFLIHRGEETINRIVIPKHTALPVAKTLTGFTTSSDQQRHIDVFLTQTDERIPPENGIFDVWRVEGLPPKAAGEVEMSLTFHYEQNGLIKLEASSEGLPLSISQQPLATSLSMLKQPPPRDIILAIDCSATMEGRAILEAKLAARQLLDTLDLTVTRLGLLVFGAHGVVLKVRLDQDPLLLRPHIASLKARGTAQLDEVLKIGIEALSTPRIDAPDRSKIILLLTSGTATRPDDAARYAERAKETDIQIMAIGIGPSHNADFLQYKICTSPAGYRQVGDPIQLSRVMASLAKELRQPGGELVKYRDVG